MHFLLSDSEKLSTGEMRFMENALADAIGAVVGVAMFGGVLTGISVGFHKLVRKPLNRAQVISTFIVSCLLCIAGVIYHRCSA